MLRGDFAPPPPPLRGDVELFHCVAKSSRPTCASLPSAMRDLTRSFSAAGSVRAWLSSCCACCCAAAVGFVRRNELYAVFVAMLLRWVGRDGRGRERGRGAGSEDRISGGKG